MTKTTNAPPTVAVLVDTSTSWGRRLIRGVTNYATKHGPWHLCLEEKGALEQFHLPSKWKGDGVIARISNERLYDELEKSGLPVINVSGIELKNSKFPRVTTNYQAGAALAIDHFLDRGFQNFGYVGPLQKRYVKRHAGAFRTAITQHNLTCHEFNYRSELSSMRSWHMRIAELGDWIESLPKPVGIFCWANTTGLHVLEACRHRNLAVPDEIAVLGGDDDPLLCESASPPMSAIVTASEQQGYHAAQFLERLLNGEAVPNHTAVDPIEITTRRSTDALIIDDDELRKAVIFLRQNAYRPLTVDQIADAVPMTRRSLERKFKKHYERSPHEEVLRLRLARVQTLLAKTDMPILDLAREAGFGNAQHMTTVFRKAFNITPLRYRSSIRAR